MPGQVVGSAVVEISADLQRYGQEAVAGVDEATPKLIAAVDEWLATAAENAAAAGAQSGQLFGSSLTEGAATGAAGVGEAVASRLSATAGAAGEEGAAAGERYAARLGEAVRAGGAAASREAAAGIRAGAPEVAAAARASAAEAGGEASASFREFGARAGERFSEGAKEGILAGKESLLLGVGALGFGELAKGSIEAADQLEGSNIKIEHVFGESADSVEEWAKSLQGSFGLSQAEAQGLAGSFAQILTPLGKGPAASAAMSEKLVELTQDMARFNNADPASVQTALISGLRGRATALRSYGVDISNTSIAEEAYRTGIAKQGATLTDAQKTQAAYNLIVKQTAKQQGAVEDSSKTLAQRQQILKAQFTNMEAELGTKLLPILTDLEGILTNDVVPGLEATGHWIEQNQEWLKPLAVTLGTALVVWKGTAAAVSLYEKAQAAAGVVTSLFAGKMALATAANEAYDAALAAGATEAEAAAAAQAELDAAMDANPIGIVVTAIAALAAGLIYAYKHSETFRDIVDSVFTVLKTIVLGAVHGIEDAIHGIVDAALTVWHALEAAWNTVGKPVWDAIKLYFQIEFAIYKTIFTGLVDAGRAIWHGLMTAWNDVGRPIFDAIKTAFSSVKTAWSAVGDMFEHVWADVIRPVFSTLAKAFLTVVGTILDGAAKMFGWAPGVGPKLKSAAAHFDSFRDQVNNALDHTATKTIRPHVDTSGARVAVQSFGSWYDSYLTSLSSKVVTPRVGAYNPSTGEGLIGVNAAGTENWRGGWSWVGESGPELMQLPEHTKIRSNSDSRAMVSSAVDQVATTVSGAALDPSLRPLLESIDDKLSSLASVDGKLDNLDALPTYAAGTQAALREVTGLNSVLTGVVR